MIGVMILEKCLDAIDCFISVIQKIYGRPSNVDKVIIISILNFLTGFLHLEVHFVRVKVDKSRDIGYVLTGIVEDSVEY